MPFCPTCKLEYRSTIRRCPDCGSYLVAQSPIDPESLREGESAQVLLCTVQGEIQAGLLRDRLRFQGIPSRAQLGGIRDSPYYLAAMPAPVSSPVDIVLRIYVRRGDLGRARQLYDDMDRQGLGGTTSEVESEEPQ